MSPIFRQTCNKHGIKYLLSTLGLFALFCFARAGFVWCGVEWAGFWASSRAPTNDTACLVRSSLTSTFTCLATGSVRCAFGLRVFLRADPCPLSLLRLNCPMQLSAWTIGATFARVCCHHLCATATRPSMASLTRWMSAFVARGAAGARGHVCWSGRR